MPIRIANKKRAVLEVIGLHPLGGLVVLTKDGATYVIFHGKE